MRNIAQDRDNVVIEEARVEAAAAAALAAPVPGDDVFSEPQEVVEEDDASGLVETPESAGEEQP